MHALNQCNKVTRPAAARASVEARGTRTNNNKRTYQQRQTGKCVRVILSFALVALTPPESYFEIQLEWRLCCAAGMCVQVRVCEATHYSSRVEYDESVWTIRMGNGAHCR